MDLLDTYEKYGTFPANERLHPLAASLIALENNKAKKKSLLQKST